MVFLKVNEILSSLGVFWSRVIQ